jgi:hypothetical protein
MIVKSNHQCQETLQVAGAAAPAQGKPVSEEEGVTP